jgi:hypothetical protein
LFQSLAPPKDIEESAAKMVGFAADSSNRKSAPAKHVSIVGTDEIEREIEHMAATAIMGVGHCPLPTSGSGCG